MSAKGNDVLDLSSLPANQLVIRSSTGTPATRIVAQAQVFTGNLKEFKRTEGKEEGVMSGVEGDVRESWIKYSSDGARFVTVSALFSLDPTTATRSFCNIFIKLGGKSEENNVQVFDSASRACLLTLVCFFILFFAYNIQLPKLKIPLTNSRTQRKCPLWSGRR
jgi:hypothetical protein